MSAAKEHRVVRKLGDGWGFCLRSREGGGRGDSFFVWRRGTDWEVFCANLPSLLFLRKDWVAMPSGFARIKLEEAPPRGKMVVVLELLHSVKLFDYRPQKRGRKP